MFVFDRTLLEIILRTAIIYFAVIAGLRLTGKREVGQMSPTDLVLLILIANAVQNAMTGPDNTVSGGLIAAATLLVLNTLVSRVARRYRPFRRIVEGNPTILIHRGKIVAANLAHEQISNDEIYQALREHGISVIEDVSLAVLEVDGSISVLKNDDLPGTSQPHHRFKFRHLHH
jgi:uncharacterized membrane protein YcaP (DUF421 family)